VDRALIEEKLESLRRCVLRVEEKCPSDIEVLLHDFDLQDILALNLSRAVQLCVDIAAHLIVELESPAPTTMGQAFDLMAGSGVIERELAGRLKKAVGFRNIAVHNYEAIDWRIVHSIATSRLGDFTKFARSVSAILDQSRSGE
jgi:uncharacterized protein YutE (UPF0331/DUF86 family)